MKSPSQIRESFIIVILFAISVIFVAFCHPAKAAPCDRCGSRDYTKTFSPVAQKLRDSLRGPTDPNADTASNGEAERPASNRTVAGSIPAGASL